MRSWLPSWAGIDAYFDGGVHGRVIRETLGVSESRRRWSVIVSQVSRSPVVGLLEA